MTTSRRWRLLMTADAVGGVFTYAVELSRVLRDHGAVVTLALLGPPASADQRDAAGEAGARLVETGLPLDWMATSSETITVAADGVAALARRLSPRLVHLHSPTLALASAPYPCKLVGVCHSCLATWWRAVRGGDMPAAFTWKTGQTRRGYLACDRLLAPSAAFAADTAAAYAIAPPAVCRNGRDWPAPGAAAAMSSGVLAAGRLWDEGKNLATLDETAGRLGSPIEAAGPCVGPEGQEAAFPHLRLPGALGRADLAARLARAGVFVSAALYEPFGLAVVEAARAGAALVLSDIPTFRELWDGAALFAPARDPAAFAVHLRRLSADAGARAALGEAAQVRARRYDSASMGRAVVGVYDEIAPWPERRAA